MIAAPRRFSPGGNSPGAPIARQCELAGETQRTESGLQAHPPIYFFARGLLIGMRQLQYRELRLVLAYDLHAHR